jgi:hypothetical protein
MSVPTLARQRPDQRRTSNPARLPSDECAPDIYWRGKEKWILICHFERSLAPFSLTQREVATMHIR